MLDMLLSTSVAAGDAEAISYVQSTATLLGVRPRRLTAVQSTVICWGPSC